MKSFIIAALLPALMLLSGCASQIGANQYDTAAVGSVNRAAIGTIISVRPVTVANNDNTAGTAIGAIGGGLAGSQIGSGSTAGILGAVGGALIGGAVGNYAEKELSSQTGYEYVVRLDTGGVVTVTQGSDILLAVGQRCMVLYGSGSDRARIVPYNGI